MNSTLRSVRLWFLHFPYGSFLLECKKHVQNTFRHRSLSYGGTRRFEPLNFFPRFGIFYFRIINYKLIRNQSDLYWSKSKTHKDFYHPLRWLTITHKYGRWLQFRLCLENGDVDFEKFLVQFSYFGVIGQHSTGLRQLSTRNVYRSRLLSCVFVS